MMSDSSKYIITEPNPLSYSSELHLSKGSFGAKVENDGLTLPAEMEPLLQPSGIASAGRFYGAVLASPQSFEAMLGWNSSDVEAARLELKGQLKGRLPDEILDPPPMPRHGFGALPRTHIPRSGESVPKATPRQLRRKLD
jgi:hypothetical protein